MLFPTLYPGDTFIIVIFYVFNFIIGLVLFPLYYSFVGKKIKGKTNSLVVNLIIVLVIVNLLPLATERIFYSAKLIRAMFIPHRMQLTAVIDFVNPFLSFIIASLIIKDENKETIQYE
jgi:hypothetical protein